MRNFGLVPEASCPVAEPWVPRARSPDQPKSRSGDLSSRKHWRPWYWPMPDALTGARRRGELHAVQVSRLAGHPR